MSDTAMTCAAAGRKGGLAILAARGRDHFRRIGAMAPRLPVEHYRRMARVGYAAQNAGRPDAAADRARAGGEALLAQRGVEHYRALGRKSQAARRGTP